MNPPSVQPAPDRLSESQRAALISLLGDEDEGVYRAVRARLLECGPAAREWLRPHRLSNDPVLRRRAVELCRHFDRQTADNRFLAFCLRNGENLDLEQGAFLLAQTLHPDANLEAHQAQLDEFAGVLRERLAGARGARTLLGTLNQYLFGELGFTGDSADYYDPDNCCLNRVVERRLGIPISLCAVYLFIARRLGLPVTGVGLPGHFLCRFQSSAEALFIDCFNQGRLLTVADCHQSLLSGHYGLGEQHLTPLKPRRILLRMCVNLHRIYFKRQAGAEITRFQRYIVALSR